MSNVIFGFIGLSLLLIAFALNFLKKMSADSKIYSLLNLVGAIFLAYYSYQLKSTPFLVLQLTWGAFALFNLVRKK